MTAKELRARGRAALSGRWGAGVGVALVAGLMGAETASFNIDLRSGVEGAREYIQRYGYDSGSEALRSVLSNPLVTVLVAAATTMALVVAAWSLLCFFIGGAADLGMKLFFLRLVSGQEARFGALVERFNILFRALGLRLFKGLFVFLWSLLLVVPGIIASYSYAMAAYIMAENPSVGIREAVDRSKAMMSGHRFRLFCLELSFIGWSFLCALSLGIGYLWLHPYMQAARAAFYADLRQGRSG